MNNRELEVAQEIADHRLGAITLLKKVDDFFWPADYEEKEEAALIVEVHRFLEGCSCPPTVPQHLDECLQQWKERALNAERRLHVYSSRRSMKSDEKGCEYCGSLEVNPKCPACNGIER